MKVVGDRISSSWEPNSPEKKKDFVVNVFIFLFHLLSIFLTQVYQQGKMTRIWIQEKMGNFQT